MRRAEAQLEAEQAAREAAPAEGPAEPIPPPQPAPVDPAATVDPSGFGPVLWAAGQAVGFKVPTVDVELYLVADEPHAEELALEGVGRGRTWTPSEIRMVLGLAVAERQRIAAMKVELDGVLAAPDTPGSWPAAIPGLGRQEGHWPLSELDPATGMWVTVPAPYRCACAAGTWTRYGATPLCFACATARR